MSTEPEKQSRYALAPLFAIRMSGVAFDVLEPAATPRAVALAREIGAALDALDRAAKGAIAALRSDPDAPGRRERDRLLRRVYRRLPPPAAVADVAPEVRAYAGALDALARLRARHDEALREELAGVSRALRRAARSFLPDYAVFASPEVEALADEIAAEGAADPTLPADRRRDRALLMYVQRVAAKNETLSAYGPVAFGRIDPAERGLRLEPRAGLHRRAFFERWVADAVVAAMNRDPAARAEVAPRLHPSARLEGDALVRLDGGARLPLDPAARALLARCDGRTPAHALGAPERLADLAERGAIVWAAECPAFVLDRVGALRAQVAAWRDGDARRRWEPVLVALAGLPEGFARDTAPSARRDVVRRARGMLAELGGGAPGAAGAHRALYRASNVLGEECTRDSDFVLGAGVARRVVEDAAPWLDLWRDAYAFVAHRVNEKLRALHVAAGGGAIPLPAYLRAAEAAGLPLTGIGLPGLAHLAFQEVKAAFREAMAGRDDARVWRLSPQDCAFLRRRFEFPRFDACTYPSADLQLAARSADDVAAGRYRWVVAELHLAAAVLQLGFPWGSRDREGFARDLRASAGGPLADWGFPTDLVSHTMLDLEPLGELWTYLGPAAIAARARAVRPAEAEVVVAEDGDVRIRAGGRDRGSFARSWVIPLGFHPFVLPLGAHTPRLEVGDVVVQREAWVVGAADLPRAPYARGAPELALDVDRLRAARGIPRYAFVRPTEAAVRRLGAGGRDKDAKPVFVDLESYPFLEVLARWLAKHGELDVTEMLPAPEELLWREAGGRRTFELRTLVVPAR